MANESDGVPALVHAGNPGPLTGPGNNTWLLDGDEPALVDAGVGRPDHVEAIAAALAGRPLRRVLLTHGHPDHASGVPALRARWPDAIVCRHVAARGGPAGEGPVMAVRDGDVIPAGRLRLTVLHTPGHAPDHVCFWEPSRRWLFAGDMLQLGNTVMIPAGRGGDMQQYVESLARLRTLGAVRAFPGHGRVIEDPDRLIDQYITHRRERDAQVRECLARGVTSPAAIAREIYGDLPPQVQAAAELTIQAHLERPLV
jgi:glyoxylase-like metal-dependent hydrolase (beta-lactamase superfamily II)